MDLAIRAVVIYFFIYLLTRVVGRRELSSLGPFDIILLVVIGDAVQQGLTQDDYSMTGTFIVVTVFAVMQVSISYLSFRFRPMRRVLEGEPIVIIQDGKPIERNLKRERLVIDEVMEQARASAQIAKMDEIQFAIIENSGAISFIQKKSSSS
jgi:uncharacterized membrane protein YcaP (DUF421 family)